MAQSFAILSVLLSVGCFAIAAANQCMCPIDHPQQKFCDSDFVFTATVKGTKEVDGYLIYKMKVSQEKVFKGAEFLDRGRKFARVYTPFGTSLCGRTNLVPGEKYLVSGTMKNGRMEISFCTWVTEWDNLTPEQIQYLKKGTYAKQCQGDGCKITGVFSAHNTDLNQNAETFHQSQLSGKWSRFNCMYNPIASAKYMDEDCENQYAVCTRDLATDRCEWEANESYDSCFNTRESVWALSHRRAPAFSRSEECREIPNRRLRRKCFRSMRRLKEALAGREEATAVLEEATAATIEVAQ